MADGAGSYNIIQDYGYGPDENPDRVDQDVYWIVAVVRLGMPLSFSRKKMGSVTKDLTQGAMLRADKPLVLTDDVLSLHVSGSKRSHKKTMGFFVKQTNVNYLLEILPGDWVFNWMFNNRDDYNRVLKKIEAGAACNEFNDGLRFVGRIDEVRKSLDIEEEGGMLTAGYSVLCSGFEELDTMFFYDDSLASKDQLQKDMGQWLTRIGLDVEALFRQSTDGGVEQNNINTIIPTLLNLIVGKGPSHKGNIDIDSGTNNPASATPELQNEAPFSYMIPAAAAALLGKKPEDASKHVLGYSDILELLSGVQQYANKDGYKVFIPELKKSDPQRRVTTIPMLGTFLPFMPEFTNRPLWSVMQQYLNPTINEMYTCLRVNPEGKVMPTMVLRQIPFTTDAFIGNASTADDPLELDGPKDTPIAATRFTTLPRWEIPTRLIRHLDVGRSNATRTNFVHIYGSSAYQANNAPIQYQIVNNPPVRDDLDIMRSGLRPYMATVECFVNDQVGVTAGSWMRLVADWTIGSHLTLNGSVVVLGIQSPICEGDNTVIDDVVYHIEGVSHAGSINTSSGKKQWRTTLTLTNGMRWGGFGFDDENAAAQGLVPIYPGFREDDNTALDPGLTLEQRGTTGGISHRTPSTDDGISTGRRESQLDPSTQDDTATPQKVSQSKRRKRARK